MSRRRRTGLLSAAALLGPLLAGPAWAEPFRVPEDYASVAAGLAAAGFGDTVSLAPGSYYEREISWPVGRAILGRSGNPNDVVIDAELQGRVLGGSDLVGENELAYLTLRGGLGSGPYGSGLRAVGDPYLHDLIIEDCTAAGLLYGIDLYARGSPRIENCTLRNNRSSAPGTEGGGAWLMGTPGAGGMTVENLDVYGNEAAFSSGIHFSGLYGYLAGVNCRDNVGDGMVIYNGSVNGSGPTLEYSLFARNSGAGLAYDADLVLRSCTLVGNGSEGSPVAALDGGSTWDFSTIPEIRQCLVAFNHGPGVRGLAITPYRFECNDVYGNAGGNWVDIADPSGSNGNLALHPQFCGEGERPYALQVDSPCAEENNDCGLLIGAYAVDCGSAGSVTSWGAVKALYGSEPKP